MHRPSASRRSRPWPLFSHPWLGIVAAARRGATTTMLAATAPFTFPLMQGHRRRPGAARRRPRFTMRPALSAKRLSPLSRRHRLPRTSVGGRTRLLGPSHARSRDRPSRGGAPGLLLPYATCPESGSSMSDELSTASKSRPVIRSCNSRKSSLSQRSSGTPERNQSLPLSARNMP
jgi:hypothetical protein